MHFFYTNEKELLRIVQLRGKKKKNLSNPFEPSKHLISTHERNNDFNPYYKIHAYIIKKKKKSDKREKLEKLTIKRNPLPGTSS